MRRYTPSASDPLVVGEIVRAVVDRLERAEARRSARRSQARVTSVALLLLPISNPIAANLLDVDQTSVLANPHRPPAFAALNPGAMVPRPSQTLIHLDRQIEIVE